ncbi:MAG: stage 0 sporulation family protein [Candidatus Omnitrophota bacterium]|nr:stage 0 sporulation family protein [Candidatus Omnitrophota bacterium]
MFEVIQVKLREAGKIIYYCTGGLKFKTSAYVIVEADRGLDYGQVASEAEVILDSDVEEPLQTVVRHATSDDLKRIEKNREKVSHAFETCVKKIGAHKLPMKLVEAEYSFDRSKIIFYFTAEGRVDFRELVKDLARIFKARIELRQIGVRDEAKMLGGFGPCGMPLCCTRFLNDFEPVTIRMAKDQNLPLNPAKMSGLCGRLMCCLGYEYKTYKELAKRLPRRGDTIQLKEGKGKVVEVNIIKQSVVVELEKGKGRKIKHYEI